MQPTDDPTPEEVALARKWAESVGITVRSYKDDKGEFHITKGGPEMLHSCMGDTLDEMWTRFAIALRPIFKSVAPLIREECAAMVEDMHPSCDGYETLPNVAAAIRGLK